MNILLAALLFLSLVVNGVLIWYTRKLVQNLYFGVNNIEEMQKLLDEYATLLEPLATMENYYADPALTSAIANTKLVVEACRVYKKTLIQNYEEENQEEDEVGQENQEGQETQTQAGPQNSTQSRQTQETGQTGRKENRRKAEATIGPISTNIS